MANSQCELRVRPISATLTRDTETFGKMDPYCVVVLGGQKKQTGVHQEAGRTPRWQDELRFSLTQEQELKFQIWDKDAATEDDLVGESVLPISTVNNSSGDWKDKLELRYRNMKAGSLNVSITICASARQPGEGGYAPQAEYRTQGPNQPSYPPQAYPTPQGYPPHQNPPQGYPPHQNPPQGYPPQQYPPQGYPPHQNSPQGYPPQQYPPQGYPPHQYPPQGYPSQQYPPQGHPSQQYPPQGYPPQQYPPQGYPAQQGVPGGFMPQQYVPTANYLPQGYY